MTLLPVAVIVALFAAGGRLILPVARRSGLGVWHPAVAWVALEALFFGIGSIALAIVGRPGPGLYVAAATAAFGLGVAASESMARRRRPAALHASEEAGQLDWRPAAILAALALAALAPTLARIGMPFFAGDITGARTELLGLPVQFVRVALPALAIGVAIDAWHRGAFDRRAAATTVGAIMIFDLLLASRYLLAELVAGMLVARGLAGRSIRARSVILIAIISVAVFAGIQLVRAWDQAGGRPFDFAIERTVNRVLLIQPRTLEALQEAIPEEQPYFAGLTWLRRLGPTIGVPDIPNLGYWVYPRLYPEQVPAGYAAPGLAGEAWANFGPAGIGLFAAFGVAVERLGALVARRRRGTADVVAGALAIVFTARTHALGLNGLAVLGLLVALWRMTAGSDRAALIGDVSVVIRWRA